MKQLDDRFWLRLPEALRAEALRFHELHMATLHHLWKRHNEVKKAHGLHPPQLGLLYHLLGMGPMHLSRLRARFPGHLSSITQMLRRMEEHGWVLRRRDASDRRKVTIELSAKARRTLRKIRPFGLPHAMASFVGLPPAERKASIEAMKRIAALFGADPDAAAGKRSGGKGERPRSGGDDP